MECAAFESADKVSALHIARFADTESSSSARFSLISDSTLHRSSKNRVMSIE
jgi:hypothetical protein